jgi:nitrite reductase/ring-hydroxylating ferredoxin subunit
MTDRYEVCPAAALPPGERTIVDVGGKSIGVFNVDGEYFALKNVCPHQLAPLCEGQVSGTVVSDGAGDYAKVRDGEIIRCPWHGWEFDLKTGQSLFNPHAVRTKSYEATVEPPENDDSGDCPPDCGTELQGDAPPVETYSVEVEEPTDSGPDSAVVVLYL